MLLRSWRRRRRRRTIRSMLLLSMTGRRRERIMSRHLSVPALGRVHRRPPTAKRRRPGHPVIHRRHLHRLAHLSRRVLLRLLLPRRAALHLLLLLRIEPSLTLSTDRYRQRALLLPLQLLRLLLHLQHPLILLVPTAHRWHPRRRPRRHRRWRTIRRRPRRARDTRHGGARSQHRVRVAPALF
jgi:hypothetical protein